MTQTLQATYEGTTLQLQEPLHLSPNSKVWITIDSVQSDTGPVVKQPETDRDAVRDTVLQIYDTDLRAKLEPDRNGDIVAIHLESHDYEVDHRSLDAWKALRLRHPIGEIAFVDIGPVAETDSLELRRTGFMASKGIS